MGRLGRKVAAAMKGYEALPEQFRSRFEAAMVAAKDALQVVQEVKVLAPQLGGEWMEVAIMTFTEGKIAGNWTKVHAELAEGAPRLYDVIKDIIPRDGALPSIGL
jgi:DNA-directed RNA polymerase subunit K/omega